jgi:signal transduction histidine kinase/ActR/RegA family two-component response regulator
MAVVGERGPPVAETAHENELQRLQDRFLVLTEAMQAFAGATTEHPLLLDTIVRRVAEIVGGFCWVALLSEDGRWLIPVASFHPDAATLALIRRLYIAIPLPVDGPLPPSIAFRSGEHVLVNDLSPAQVLARFSPEDHAAVLGVGVRHALLAPLRAQGKSIGVLSMARCGAETAPLDQADVRFLRCLADHAALALSNARLLADAQRELAERRRTEEALLRTEEQLRQAQKMEAIGRLAGGVAHDFNNLLSVVLSYSHLLLDDLAATDPMRADLEEIKKAGERGADLTRQLLAFSRQQVIEPRILDLNHVVESMDKMIRRLIGEDIELKTSPGRELGRVVTDPGHIEQVILNLVVNARDAMPDGGTLTIETGNAELDEAYAREHLGVTPGAHVMLAISDSGSGMDRATQERIFEPFFTTKEKGKGTGLGLSTVFGIVKQSGGSIWVYSEPGNGTTFKVYLPRTDETATALGRAVRLTTVRGSETILLVEDDDPLRVVACGILRKNGYRVLDARSGGEALLLCERLEQPIDLLLTDVVMPQMSGRELARRLTRLRPDLRVLYMSGYTEDAVVHQRVLDAGITLLQKPITPDVLLHKVRELLEAPRANPR